MTNKNQGEVLHRGAKNYYGRTNKRDAVGQISALEQRQRTLQCIEQRVAKAHGECVEDEEPELQSLNLPYRVSIEAKKSFNIFSWAAENEGNPALDFFRPNLLEHILHRLFPTDETVRGKQMKYVIIPNDKLYRHLTLKLTYTTYDIQRGQDNINPNSHPDIMMITHESEDDVPYEYARVMGIFRAHVSYFDFKNPRTEPVQMEFLWIRRFELISRGSPFTTKRYTKVKFHDNSHRDAYGFVAPDKILRAVHVMPVFADGKDVNGWKAYYINK